MDEEKLQSLRWAGALLALTALLAAVLMHHHPHGGDSPSLIRGVHGGVLLMIAVQPAVLGLLAQALGWRPGTALALTFFALGSVGAVLAGTINGFVVPAIHAYPDGEIGPGITALAWEMNQALARLGAIAVGIGIALFGYELWRAGWRWIGGVGVLAGLVPAVLQASGIADMRFEGAIWTYVTQLAWLIALGVALWRGRATG